tara:strand:+ start:37403 stop:37678 length:276 start_codon:yes stop_codon:yes gene_type:complete
LREARNVSAQTIVLASGLAFPRRAPHTPDSAHHDLSALNQVVIQDQFSPCNPGIKHLKPLFFLTCFKFAPKLVQLFVLYILIFHSHILNET